MTHLWKLVQARTLVLVSCAGALALSVQAVVAEAAQGGRGDHRGAAAAESSSSSSLPFTALDMALLLGAGGLFIGVGLVMRRLATRSKLA